MKKQTFLSVTIWLLLVVGFDAQAQEKQYSVSTVGFYNLENLFDTINQPDVNDEEFTPTGANLYTPTVYLDKLGKLEELISDIGKDFTPDGLAVFGVAEIENASVLKDLANQPKLKPRNYQYVHYDSPDLRGIDVGLMYNPKYFKVVYSQSLHVPLKDADGTPRHTRDVLYVYGLFLGEPMHFFVNHWPSRRGGEEASAPGRALAAQTAKSCIDSIMKDNPDAKVVLMGDLNDDPVSPSVAKVLGASANKEKIKKSELYNPWVSYYKEGIGTLAYNDAWNLFDQIIISESFLSKEQKGFFMHKALIYRKEFMIQNSGRYKGYPKRTYDFSVYLGGYSDHFPTYLVLLKEK
ncbi:MAG: endonuclease/exonuclease/phosphatase family protein [Bacteroidetes bacterium]|nr:endonuclease/exonuclease/phosphatase family protein [Bacteroidota bacterium]